MVIDIQISGNRPSPCERLCKMQFSWACVELITNVNAREFKIQQIAWKKVYKRIFFYTSSQIPCMFVTFKESPLAYISEKLFYWSSVIGCLSWYYVKNLRLMSFLIPEIFTYSVGITCPWLWQRWLNKVSVYNFRSKCIVTCTL